MSGSHRFLDFDIENRPLSYWVPDMPTAEITAIASCWSDDLGSMEVLALGELTGHEILSRFVERYNQADMVTGHYIRKHDLPIVNAMLMEARMPLLGSKMTCDTRLDMVKKADLPATQEYLLDMLDVRDVYGQPLQKLHMGQADWREANRLTDAGIAKTKERVSSDVYGHIALRKAMLAAGMLGRPKVWSPGGGGSVAKTEAH